ncbi:MULTISPECIES: hypothetical protein [Bacillales]|nr:MULTISPECIES: hypothetical protein [Bacillales]
MSKRAIIAEADVNELSADDLALWGAVILIIGDLFGLFAIIKERTESSNK